jgi:Putative adhesin
MPGVIRPVSGAGLRLLISTTSGRVDVVAEARADVVVEGGTMTGEGRDGAIEIRAARPSQSIVVRCPTGTDVFVGTVSGRVALGGRFGAVGVTSASGRIHAESVAEADLRTASAKVDLDECSGRCRVSTKSGAVRVGLTDQVDIATVSGRVKIELVAGAADVRTVSGTVTLSSGAGGPINVQTLSGPITIRLPEGVRPTVRASNRRAVRCRCDEGDDVTIDVAALSGRVEILPR